MNIPVYSLYSVGVLPQESPGALLRSRLRKIENRPQAAHFELTKAVSTL